MPGFKAIVPVDACAGETSGSIAQPKGARKLKRSVSSVPWYRLEERWNEIQVGRQGSYSIERLENLDHYCKTASLTRVLLVCVLSPIPALVAA